MPFDQIRKVLRGTDTESVRKAANDPQLHPRTRNEAKEILKERGEDLKDEKK